MPVMALRCKKNSLAMGLARLARVDKASPELYSQVHGLPFHLRRHVLLLSHVFAVVWVGSQKLSFFSNPPAKAGGFCFWSCITSSRKAPCKTLGR
jgi:hypothetical protein